MPAGAGAGITSAAAASLLARWEALMKRRIMLQ